MLTIVIARKKPHVTVYQKSFSAFLISGDNFSSIFNKTVAEYALIKSARLN